MAEVLRRHKTASNTLWVEDLVFGARGLRHQTVGIATKMIRCDAGERFADHLSETSSDYKNTGLAKTQGDVKGPIFNPHST